MSVYGLLGLEERATVMDVLFLMGASLDFYCPVSLVGMLYHLHFVV